MTDWSDNLAIEIIADVQGKTFRQAQAEIARKLRVLAGHPPTVQKAMMMLTPGDEEQHELLMKQYVKTFHLTSKERDERRRRYRTTQQLRTEIQADTDDAIADGEITARDLRT